MACLFDDLKNDLSTFNEYIVLKAAFDRHLVCSDSQLCIPKVIVGYNENDFPFRYRCTSGWRHTATADQNFGLAPRIAAFGIAELR
jgi:hypothetical protein